MICCSNDKRRAVSDPSNARKKLENILRKHDNPTDIILEILNTYHFDLSSLQQSAAGEWYNRFIASAICYLGVGFYEVTWIQVAPWVGFKPQFGLRTVPYISSYSTFTFPITYSPKSSMILVFRWPCMAISVSIRMKKRFLAWWLL